MSRKLWEEICKVLLIVSRVCCLVSCKMEIKAHTLQDGLRIRGSICNNLV